MALRACNDAGKDDDDDEDDGVDENDDDDNEGKIHQPLCN